MDGGGGLGVLGLRIKIEGRGVYSVQEEPTHNVLVIACFRRENTACVLARSRLAHLCACINFN